MALVCLCAVRWIRDGYGITADRIDERAHPADGVAALTQWLQPLFAVDPQCEPCYWQQCSTAAAHSVPLRAKECHGLTTAHPPQPGGTV